MTSGTSEIRLYNTLTKSKELFVPIDQNNVRMYVCGPTVYDYAHIGNARPAIVFDVLFRLLRHTYGDDHVTYVRNITDVDDKINARALRDFGDQISSGELTLNQAIREVTKKTEDQYRSDMRALGCLDPTVEPRATAHIEGMVDMIQQLLDKGNAYIATGEEGTEVLFDTTSMPDYGRLSRRNLDEQKAGARVAVEAHKKNPADFVLWKESSESQPGWQGSFKVDGQVTTIHGRPGWHIECSVMSEQHLGKTFDIHGGGLDLIFPHHENEIAQSRCAHGTEAMANIWMHNGFLQVEGEKMSKSLGNFYTVHELLAEEKFGGRAWPGEVLRLAMLMTHYREPIDFSLARLEEAESMLIRWKKRILDLGLEFSDAKRAEMEALGPCSKLAAELENDLNMSGVVAELHRHAGGDTLHNGERLFGSLRFLGILNFSSMAAFAVAQEEAEAPFDESRLAERLTALANRDFATADRIRDELAAEGIQLMDYKDPDSGERKTKWEVKR